MGTRILRRQAIAGWIRVLGDKRIMAIMPESLKFTPEEQAKLEAIRVKARARHERERKAAAKRGRKDYPMLPYECSWAYEEQFRRAVRNPAPEPRRRFGFLSC